jgi:hypothetical protein
MEYSYFPTNRSAEKWVRENLDYFDGEVVLRIVVGELSVHHYRYNDKCKWYVYYPLRAIKPDEEL